MTMKTVRNHKRWLPVLVALGLTLSLGVLLSAAITGMVSDESPPREAWVDQAASSSAQATGGEGNELPMWEEIDELIEQQRFQAAAEKVEKLLEASIEQGDESDWTRSLIRLVQLQTALHGFETAVQTLQDRAWPTDELDRTVLQLFYAQGLVNYLNVYSWEIGSREQMGPSDDLGLEKLTQDQIFSMAQQAYEDIWERRRSLAAQPLEILEEYLVPNNYPPGIRSTLRDGVTYLWIELLSNSAFWRPQQSNETFRLDLASMVKGIGESEVEVDLPNGSLHPLTKMGLLLDDLENWHRRAGRTDAAAQARIEKLSRFFKAFDQQDDRDLIKGALDNLVAELGRESEWWSVGQAELARMVQQDVSTDALIRARAIALKGKQAHPGTIGARMCQGIVELIEVPGYDITSMRSDGLNRRSIEVQHKNLESIYFRAYPIDIRRQIEVSRDYNLLPGYQEIPEILKGQEPTAAWRTDLPATTDFRLHKTWVTPPFSRRGLFLIVASGDEDFSGDNGIGNHLAALYLQISDLTIVTRDVAGGFEVEILSGSSGRSLSGVVVDLFQYNYQKGHRLSSRQTTGLNGEVRFRVRDRQNRGYFFVAAIEDDLALDLTQQRIMRPRQPREQTASLIYTDRSVYRPRQEIFWKVVAYEGLASEGRFETLPSRAVTIHLLDGNGESVSSLETTTNHFGSASGSFEIPTGRMLGQWRLQSSLNGYSSVRVEEYKRPSFEVSLIDPETPLRLNRTARLIGHARYYFGLPVAGGDVTWSVVRMPLYPPWWHWWYGASASSSPQVVATGDTQLDADGGFELTFVPEADEREAATRGLSYNYQVRADVTDEGGETRSAERSVRLGFVAVEAEISSEKSFFQTLRAVTFSIQRADLNGVPRSGTGSWQLYRLQQPAKTLLPAEQPLPDPMDGKNPFSTSGDLKRSRWDPRYDPAQILRLWPVGKQMHQGDLSHDDSGLAEVTIDDLDPGAYRIRYRTRDEYGAELETQRDFVVTGEGQLPVALPALLLIERSSVAVGDVARILVHTALEDQVMELELFRNGSPIGSRRLQEESASDVIEIPIEAHHRGGFGVRLTLLRDHQLMTMTESVMVPWDDRRLEVGFSSFRNLLRPGQKETWRVEVDGLDGQGLESGTAELLAYMYDRSLDLFAPHTPPNVESIYPTSIGVGRLAVSLGSSRQVWTTGHWAVVLAYSQLHGDRLKFFDRYPIGGLGRGRGSMKLAAMGSLPASVARMESVAEHDVAMADEVREISPEEAAPAPPPVGDAKAPLRADFSETAFWQPHLILDETGSVAFEFTVPDSVTEWNVWVHAVTNDLRGGSLQRQSRSVKELMVRPYLPRFLREGDRAELRVVINNASDDVLQGLLDLDINDPDSGASLLPEFGLSSARSRSVPFTVAAGQGETLTFEIQAPMRVGKVAVEVRARAGDLSDGEARALPLLPGRMHLSQSRFATLRDQDRRTLSFEDLESSDDPSLLQEQLVVTLDAQLFYGVLDALPYLVNYPYECTEQTLNRFVSTGIVSSLYESYPEVAEMARQFSQRETRVEAWDDIDPNRKITLEETPWLMAARGGDTPYEDLVNVLDPKIARAQMKRSIAKLQQAQTSLGGFPWWAGGPPSPYMTLYLLHGLSRAIEFDVEVPQQLVTNAWRYLHRHYVDEIVDGLTAQDCCWEIVTFLNYVLSSYRDQSWTAGVFSDDDRQTMLDFSFRHWEQHSPLLKSYLALTLARSGRDLEAELVFASVMDSAKSSRDEGVFWAPEDRAWLWYNDTIETHAFALRTLLELDPTDERRHGMVQWLFLNKKLNHWKSTRATAEVIYSLVQYLEQEGTLGVREAATVRVAGQTHEFVFEPDTYSGHENQIVLAGDEVAAAVQEGTTQIVVEKDTPGFLFASATWHFSTERLPIEASGDLFSVRRRYFKRVGTDEGFVLQPIAEGAQLEVGDQVEVQLSIRAKSAAEYVHLRDPRGAGFEPESTSSGYKWDLGIYWYEEIRDTGTNFFFEHLPVGEYKLRYRMRATMAGTFRAAPANLQSMYAPEFTAYSAGSVLEIGN